MPKFNFYERIKNFNKVYGLANNDKPTDLGAQRILDFQSILKEELEEGLDIAKKYDPSEPLSSEARLEILTDMSDWLGDIVVYAASEARRWGLPMEEILKIIMDSNSSKLGSDGKPIYDDRGKVMKGPNYWKPEPKIKELLKKLI